MYIFSLYPNNNTRFIVYIMSPEHYPSRPATYQELVELAGSLSLVSEDANYWREQALCAETDPEVFFPKKGASASEAKAVCSRCEVTSKCLDWALEHKEDNGVWGGLSRTERMRLSAKKLHKARQQEQSEEAA